MPRLRPGKARAFATDHEARILLQRILTPFNAASVAVEMRMVIPGSSFGNLSRNSGPMESTSSRGRSGVPAVIIA